MISTEYEEQCVVKQYCDAMKIPMFAIPNGGSRGGKVINGKWAPLEAVRLKKSGVSAGVPDLFIPVPMSPYCGLFIEMKKRNGKKSTISANQEYWLSLLSFKGYDVHVAFGADSAIQKINKYMEGKNVNDSQKP